MSKYVYPAVLTKSDGIYNVDFPDIDGCHTFGKDLPEALEMAADVLCLMLYEMEESKSPIPAASEIKSIKNGDNTIVTLISVNTVEY